MDNLINRQSAISAVGFAMADSISITREDWNAIIEALEALPSAQPELVEKVAYIRGFEQGRTQGMIDTKAEEVAQPTCNQLATDTIRRQAAINAVTDELDMIDHVPQWVFDRLEKRLKQLSSAQPEITDEQAIEHLQSTGWMQNHDREMYYMGLKKQLADDSGSYDSLLPSAQPEIIRCKDCKYSEHSYRNRRRCFLWSEDEVSVFDDGYCNYAERKTNG